MQHRRKENEILATDQRHLYVRSTREAFVEVHCRVKPGKSATGNDYSSRLHAITANRNATRAIKILLMEALYKDISTNNFNGIGYALVRNEVVSRKPAM